VSDLNIRAAKALGWVVFKERADCFHVPEALNTSVTNNIMPVRTMKFTTSYDWAMLGVKKINDAVVVNEFYDTLWGNIEFGHVLDATPEQITQAWVEVLEND
jgi:hypothetical protein